jgi:hypothetical protein
MGTIKKAQHEWDEISLLLLSKIKWASGPKM